MTDDPIQDDDDEVTPTSPALKPDPKQYDIGPVGPPVVGHAAVDPGLPPRPEEHMSPLHWGLAQRLKPIPLALFVAWARLNEPPRCTHRQWAETYERFLRSPVR